MRSLMALLMMSGMPFVHCFDGGVVCTQVYVYGITVTLQDAQTGAAVSNATVTLTDGSYTEAMGELSPGNYAGAGERPGNYTIRVQAGGYQEVVVVDVSVTSDICHVIPVQRTISLQPQ